MPQEVSFLTGMSVPDYHAGDQAQAGSAIAQVVDPTELELKAKISERNRGNVKQGQSVDVVFDALPGRSYHARSSKSAEMSTREFFEDNAGGTFDVTMQLSDADAPLHSGMTAQLLFLGDTQKRCVLPASSGGIPQGWQAHRLPEKAARGYEQKEIEIKDETESRAVIKGLSDGTSIAMIDPTLPRKQQKRPGNAGGGTP